jgi:hypothetical protein
MLLFDFRKRIDEVEAVIVQLNFDCAWNFSTSIVNQDFADITYSVRKVRDFLSTSITIELNPPQDWEEFMLETVIRTNWQGVISTLDVEFETARSTTVKERSIVRSTTNITAIFV